MKKKIRHGVFETNSSSSHSISFSHPSKLDIPDIKTDIEVHGGEFGWEHDVLYSWKEKLSYLFTNIARDAKDMEELKCDEYFVWLVDLFKSKFNVKLIPRSTSDIYYPFGYIDHQSLDILDKFFIYDKEMFQDGIFKLLFDKSISIIIDNDN